MINNMLSYRIKTKVSPGVFVLTYSELDNSSIKYKTELILSFAIEKAINYPVAWTSSLEESLQWHQYACQKYQQYVI